MTREIRFTDSPGLTSEWERIPPGQNQKTWDIFGIYAIWLSDDFNLWSDWGRNLESFQVYVTHLFNLETYIYNKKTRGSSGINKICSTPDSMHKNLLKHVETKKHRPTCFDHLHPSLTLCIPICLHPVPCGPLKIWKLNTKSNGTVTFWTSF